MERRAKFEIRHRLAEVASDRPRMHKLVGMTIGLTLSGTLLAVASDTDLHLSVPTMAVVADRSLVLYFAKSDFAHKVESGRSTIYVPDSVPVPAVLLAP